MSTSHVQLEPSIGELREELQTVLGSRAFRQAKNLAKLLRYLCSHALLDRDTPITEYAIAIDVLGKPIDFKDVRDASVRVEVHRLRKRLAQFYEEEGAERRLRIRLPSGSYLPSFEYSEAVSAEAARAAEAGAALESAPASEAEEVLEQAENAAARPLAALPAAPPAVRIPEPPPPGRVPLARAHLEHVLASAPFRSSKRYAAVLRYIVEHSLGGSAEPIRERNIGEVVFGRSPDYDTSADHVVRSAVAEVRKRLASYYQEVRGEGVVIELQPGTYQARFLFPAEGETPAEESPTLREIPAPEHASRRRFLIPVLVVAVLGAAVALYMAFGRESALDGFWNPILSSPGEALLCIGDTAGGIGPTASVPAPISLVEYHTSPAKTLHTSDATALAQLAGLLASRGKSFRVLSQSDATFTDLQKGPTVLIGFRNNDWMVRLSAILPYTVAAAGPHKFYIQDRKNPANTAWSVDYSLPYLEIKRDYAVALRVVDPKTDRPVAAAAGITVFGTMAAAEFLTDPEEMAKLAARDTSGWKKRNIEVILSTEVVRGSASRPEVIAFKFW